MADLNISPDFSPKNLCVEQRLQEHPHYVFYPAIFRPRLEKAQATPTIEEPDRTTQMLSETPNLSEQQQRREP